MIQTLNLFAVISTLIAVVCNASTIEIIGSIDPSSVYAMKDLTSAYMLGHTTHRITTRVSSNDRETIESLASHEVDFGIITTSVPANIAASNPSLYMIPFLLNALVPIYRLDVLGDSVSLIIPREVLPRIFSGNITRFDDLVSSRYHCHVLFTHNKCNGPNERIMCCYCLVVELWSYDHFRTSLCEDISHLQNIWWSKIECGENFINQTSAYVRRHLCH